MKKILSLIFLGMFSLSVFAQLSEADRMFAVKYLKVTHHDIVKTISELDDDAFNWQPADGGWSVSNCLEHILLTEAAFHGMVQGGLENGEANPEFDNSMADGMLIGSMTDRGFQATTSANFEPSGKWAGKDEMLAALEESRMMLTEYLENTAHDLRHYSMTTPMAEVDAYQIYLMVGAHSQRHTTQMKEVIAEMQEAM